MPKNDFLDQGSTDQTIKLPKHNHWSVLIISLILISASAGGWYFWNQQALKSIDTFAACRDSGGAILESHPEQCVINGQTFSDSNQAEPEPSTTQNSEPKVEEPKIASYTDIENNFSIQYPADFKQLEKEIPTPYTNSATPVPAKVFFHTIPVEYCNLKGDCVPETTDISIAFSVVNSSVATINQSKVKDELTNITFGENTFRFMTQGVEGEGIYYYFISLPNKKTLMITRTYLDENILTSYKNAADFIDKFNQDKLAKQVLMSLSFDGTQTNVDTKDWKTYTNSKYNFSFKYPEQNTAYVTTDANAQKLIPASATENEVRISEKESLLFCCEAQTIAVSVHAKNSSEGKTLEGEFGINKPRQYPSGGTNFIPQDFSSSESLTKTTFLGKEAYAFSGAGSLGSPYKVLAIIYGNYYMVIEQNARTPILNTILQSFTFTK
jgi:hypothetical protein